jgi:hypothetical protein
MAPDNEDQVGTVTVGRDVLVPPRDGTGAWTEERRPGLSPYRSCSRHGGAMLPVSVMETVGPSSVAWDSIHFAIEDPDLGNRARNCIVQGNETLSCFEKQSTLWISSSR